MTSRKGIRVEDSKEAGPDQGFKTVEFKYGIVLLRTKRFLGVMGRLEEQKSSQIQSLGLQAVAGHETALRGA
nr:hypothetical protein [Ferrimicrobium acidiphilum]